jgi:molybdate transport system regulatory protein
VSETEPRQKLWLERDGRLVMSGYRMRLLLLIAESESLAKAASAMGLSYRRAWGKVKEMEANLGVPLVSSEVGGTGGGHTTLTPEAANLVAAYGRFQQRMAAAMDEAFAVELAGLRLGAAAPPEGGAGAAAAQARTSPS